MLSKESPLNNVCHTSPSVEKYTNKYHEHTACVYLWGRLKEDFRLYCFIRLFYKVKVFMSCLGSL